MPIQHFASLSLLNQLEKLPAKCSELQTQIENLFGENGSIAPPGASSGPHASVQGLIEKDAEKILSVGIDDLNGAFSKFKSDHRACWLIVDDSQAPCLERPIFEIKNLFEKQSSHARRWLPIIWWSSQILSREELFFTAREQLYFQAQMANRGPIANFKTYLMVRGQALRFSERPIDPDQLTLSNEIASQTRRYFNSSNLPELVACIYGDKVAESLGFKPLGFPDNAGHIASLVFV